MADGIPIACCLSDEELRVREATLLVQFKRAVIATQELEDGYCFHLPGDRERLVLVADLMVAERQCCPFLRFDLAAEPNLGPLTLTITGPAGAKELLKSVLF